MKLKEYEIEKVYLETGELKKEIVYENGKVFLITVYYINGNIKSKMYMRGKVKHGNVVEFYPNGQLKSDIDYENDIPVDGPYTIYLDDGSVWEKGTFKNNGKEIELVIKSGNLVEEVFTVKENFN